MSAAVRDHDVLCKFGPGIPGDAQAKAMLAFEKHLREQGFPCEVFKETMADDSRLRRSMTQEQRDKL
jgi:hypothetical protein